MGLFKWISRAGSVGGTNRWAIETYKALRKENPDPCVVSDMELFRRMVEFRYSIVPDTEAKAFLTGYLGEWPIGLRTFMNGMQRAEGRFMDPFNYPSTFSELVDEELAKSGLPASVIDDPRR